MLSPRGTASHGRVFVAMLLMMAGAAHAAVTWPIERLHQAPAFTEAPEHAAEGVRAVFFEGLPWQGKPTRVFAYIGLPDAPAGKKVPGMVLVHGGGGSAFVRWVKLWNSRGYAAIAMDTCGAISGNGHNNHTRHEQGGPPGWGGWEQGDWPAEDQWAYHAVAAVVSAHSFLRSLPEVDADRIGMTGISWGGYLSLIAGAVDGRFRFVVPVYGCGYLTDDSAWLGQFKKLGPEKAELWRTRWDPSQYLERLQCPILWVNGTNDFAFPMGSWRKSHRATAGPDTLSLQVGMKHGHGEPGENPAEIHAFADSFLKDGAPLLAVGPLVGSGGRAEAKATPAGTVRSAELCVTADTGRWQERRWTRIEAQWDAQTGTASVPVPEGATAWFLSFTDGRGLVVTSEHAEVTDATR